MASERQQRARALYELALQRPPAERSAFVTESARGDNDLRRDVEVLLFDLLGTPAAQKRRVPVDAGHVIPRSEMLVPVLDWLDESLGPVR